MFGHGASVLSGAYTLRVGHDAVAGIVHVAGGERAPQTVYLFEIPEATRYSVEAGILTQGGRRGQWPLPPYLLMVMVPVTPESWVADSRQRESIFGGARRENDDLGTDLFDDGRVWHSNGVAGWIMETYFSERARQPLWPPER